VFRQLTTTNRQRPSTTRLLYRLQRIDPASGTFEMVMRMLHYSVCASNAVCSSCHHTALQCVCQQCCLQFVSPYCITVCVPAMLSAVRVTILHYSVCASKAVCSSCHHTALQCVCQQGCLQFVSPYCITVCVPARLSAIRVTILPDWPNEGFCLSMLRRITTVLGAAVWGVTSYAFRVQPISDSSEI